MVLFYRIIQTQFNGGEVEPTDFWTYLITTCLLEVFVLSHLRRGKKFLGGEFIWDFIASSIISVLVADIAADLLVEYVYQTADNASVSTFDESFLVYGWLVAIFLPLVLFVLSGLVVYWVEFGGHSGPLFPSRRILIQILRGPTISQIAQIYSALVTIVAVIMYVKGTYATGAYRAYSAWKDNDWAKLTAIRDQMVTASNPFDEAYENTGSVSIASSMHCRIEATCTNETFCSAAGDIGKDAWDINFEYLDVIDAFLQPSLIIDYLVRFFFAANISAHFREMYSIADFFSISELPGYLFSLSSRNLVPSFGFLKFLRLIRIFNLDICKSFMSEITKEIGVLIMVLLSMFWLCAGLLQSLEVDNNPDFSCFHTCMYNSVVTLTTIGFGDMNPGTDSGKFMVSLIIIIGVGLFSKQAGNLMEVSAMIPKYGGKFISKSDEGHVIIGGNLTDDTIAAFLEEFFHSNHQGNYSREHRVIILSPKEPSAKLKKLLKNSLYRVTYRQGSTHKMQDLKRVGIMDADAIFVMSNKLCANPKQEDISVIMSTIAIEKTRREIPTFVQVLNKSSIGDVLTAGADVVVCVNQYRETMFASTAHCFGLSTFFGNLSRSCDYDGSAYADGCDYELYTVPVASKLVGQTFSKTAMSVYKEHRMICMGVYTNTKSSEDEAHGISMLERRGSQTGLTSRRQSAGLRKRGAGGGRNSLAAAKQGHVHQAKRAFQWSEQNADYFDDDVKEENAASKLCAPLTAALMKVGLGCLVPASMQGKAAPRTDALKRKLLNLRSGGTLINPQSDYKIQKDDMLIIMAVDQGDAQKVSADSDSTKAVAVGSKLGAGADSAESAVTEVKSGLPAVVPPGDGDGDGVSQVLAHTRARGGCHAILDYHNEMEPSQGESLQAFMKRGITYDKAVVSSFETRNISPADADVEKYMLVLGNWSTEVIRNIVLTGWRRKQHTHVVFMGNSLPSDLDWCDLNNGVLKKGEPRTFPLVTLVKGSPLNRADLKRAGIYSASAVCIVSDFGQKSAKEKEVEMASGKARSKDGKTIKISLVIRQIQKELQDKHDGELERNPASAEEQATCSMLFPVYELIDPINTSFVDQSPYVAREVALAPVYRGGHIFVPTMLDTLLCQSFFNPQITNILEVLLTSLTQIHLCDDPELKERIQSPEGLTYAQLFEHLMNKQNVMVALYSQEMIDENNETTDNMSFVEKLRNVGRRVVHRMTASSDSTKTSVSPRSPIDTVVRPCLFTNPDQDRKLRIQDVALVIAPASKFNDTWGVY